jgi:nucleolin
LTCSPLKARTITTSTRSGLAFTQKWHTPTFQKRFASDEATKTTDDHEAVTTETDVAEKSVPDVADAASEQSSILDQVKDKAQEAASNVTEAASGAASTFTHAAESILGSRDSGASTSHDDVKPSRILYVGNLFFEIKGQDLDREFSPYGKLVNARVAEDARGLSRGYVCLNSLRFQVRLTPLEQIRLCRV